MLRARTQGDAGITLIEIIITMSLLSLVIAPATLLLLSHQRTEIGVSDATRQIADARIAIERISRAVREAGYPAGLNYSNSEIVTGAEDYDFTVYTDVDGDGFNDKVRYHLDTSQAALLRDVTVPVNTSGVYSYTDPAATTTTSRLVDSVRNANPGTCGVAQPVFTYWTADRGTGALTQITNPGLDIGSLVQINYVKITLLLDIKPNRSPTCQVLGTSISLRNWRG
jgi:type II secretory pathway pseudopilin PulG